MYFCGKRSWSRVSTEGLLASSPGLLAAIMSASTCASRSEVTSEYFFCQISASFVLFITTNPDSSMVAREVPLPLT